MSIYNITLTVREALLLVATPNHIQSGFRVLGAWRTNINIFIEDTFLLSAVTDRPCPGSIRILSLEFGKSRLPE